MMSIITVTFEIRMLKHFLFIKKKTPEQQTFNSNLCRQCSVSKSFPVLVQVVRNPRSQIINSGVLFLPTTVPILAKQVGFFSLATHTVLSAQNIPVPTSRWRVEDKSFPHSGPDGHL